MKIDWFTILAQAINFLILIWLMKRFLYKPILQAIQEREKRIAAELSNAAKKEAEAQKEGEELKQKNKEFNDQRDGLMIKATTEAQAERERLLDETRKTSAALSLKQQEALKSDLQNLHQSISRRTQQEIFAIAGKVLTDLAGMNLEGPIVNLFISRMRELKEKDRALLVLKLKTSLSPIVVRTSFELSPEFRASILKVVEEILGRKDQTQFMTSSDLICGIELTSNGQKLAWNIADYLDLLSTKVDDLLQIQEKPEVKVEPKPEKSVVDGKAIEHGI